MKSVLLKKLKKYLAELNMYDEHTTNQKTHRQTTGSLRHLLHHRKGSKMLTENKMQKQLLVSDAVCVCAFVPIT
jgi:hypothetical protein